MTTIDILMITCNRPHYTRLSLPKLLESCDESMRVWLWHNGNDAETLDVVKQYADHPRVHRFHHSSENLYVIDPINWLFTESDAELLSVIADDCVVSPGWAAKLARAHRAIPRLGIVACWHFPMEDFCLDRAQHKISEYAPGVQLMANPWVQGSGIMLKRACATELGTLPMRDRGFTPWCIRLTNRGWINGWHYPLVPIDHLDDPRSKDTMLRTDADLADHLPLSARFRGIDSLDDWVAHLKRSARIVQEAPSDPRLYVGVRKKVRRLMTRLRREELMY